MAGASAPLEGLSAQNALRAAEARPRGWVGVRGEGDLLSLTGNLEDLPLLDILQIVSFSKKTGYLTIRTGDGEGAIVFQDGFVVASFAWDSPPIDPRVRSLPRDKRGRLIRARIEGALEQLIRLRDGQFSFSLTDQPPRTVGSKDISEETLERGLNAQELLLDLARGMDEDRRDSTAALEASFAEPADEAPEAAANAQALEGPPLEPSQAESLPEAGPSPSDEAATGTASRPAPAASGGEAGFDTIPFPRSTASPAGPQPRSPESAAPPVPAPAGEAGAQAPEAAKGEELRTLLLVDDEEDVRRVLAQHFTRGGYQVLEAQDPEDAVKKAHRLGKAGIDFLLVTDLGMPTSGGSSFQGGFEVVKRLNKMNLRPPVLLMAESLSGSLQARAKQMGIAAFVFKPGLSKLDPEQFSADLRAFARKLLSDVIPRMKGPTQAKPRPGGPAQAAAAGPVTATAEELSRQFAMLQRRLDELRRPGDASQISQLVMKVAREFFERSILFLVKNEEMRGLGGFGPAPREENITLLAREIVIPLSEPSVFLDVVTSRRPFNGPLSDGKWGRYLVGKIGRFRSNAMALLPLLTHRETIALLFGDNPETGRALGPIEGLELFINQAGIALENVFLQRKLQAQQPRPS